MNALKLIVGLPVYNGEKFIRKRLENILSQTYSDFKLIIDVDPGTDNTVEICKEFAEKDSRINLIVQKERMGLVWSFNHILQNANSKYFVWAGVDDIWSPDFLEKNLAVLDSNKDVVGSIGKVKRYGPYIEEFKSKNDDSLKTKLYKKFRRSFRPFGVQPITSNSYETRIRTFLKIRDDRSIWAVYRTEILKKCIELDSWNFCLPMMLNLLKHGKLNVIDEFMIDYYSVGGTALGILEYYHRNQITLRDVVFPWSAFTLWCMKNLDTKIFLKNFDHFILLQCLGFTSQIMIFRDWLRNKGKRSKEIKL